MTQVQLSLRTDTRREGLQGGPKGGCVQHQRKKGSGGVEAKKKVAGACTRGHCTRHTQETKRTPQAHDVDESVSAVEKGE